MGKIAATADSPECMDMAKSWLQECLTDHAKCGQRQPSGEHHQKPLPDRVIYVGADREPYVFCNADKTAAPYAALSHRWGGNIRPQLKRDNLQDLIKRIPLLDFSKTFRDAVTVCRALNIQYLWIDSLCIVQDSPQDWEEQSGKMVRVYSDALLTIAADAAENSEAGFLNGTRGVDRSQFRLLSSAHQIFARPEPKTSYEGGFLRHFYVGTGKSLLADRGWAFQEKLLSPRILHFTEDELTWECASLSRCECRVRRFDEEVIYDLIRPEHLEDAEGWTKITEEYTGRQLTYATDRLAALSGLAAQAQTFRPGIRYLGGLWEGDLPNCLLWNIKNPTSCKRLQPTIAPSWSWACLDGKVKPRLGPRYYSLLGDIVIDYPATESNPYGSLPAGRRATLTATTNLYNCRAVRLKWSKYYTVYDASLTNEGECPGEETASFEGTIYPDTREDLESLKAGERVVLIKVAELDNIIMLRYIILRRLGECDCTFQRMGIFSGYDSSRERMGKGIEKRITII